jgi:hypothetical protein
MEGSVREQRGIADVQVCILPVALIFDNGAAIIDWSSSVSYPTLVMKKQCTHW